MKNLVTVKSSDLYNDLVVAKSYLEDNDIPCFLKDEYTNQVHPVAIGGIKLQVREEDVQRAIDLLIIGDFARIEDFEPSKSILWISKVLDKVSSIFRRK